MGGEIGGMISNRRGVGGWDFAAKNGKKSLGTRGGWGSIVDRRGIKGGGRWDGADHSGCLTGCGRIVGTTAKNRLRSTDQEEGR